MKDGDVPLPLDGGTERQRNDIENTFDWFTGKRCCQMKIRERRILDP